MKYLITAEISVQWNIIPLGNEVLCAEGRIDGVSKEMEA